MWRRFPEHALVPSIMVHTAPIGPFPPHPWHGHQLDARPSPALRGGLGGGLTFSSSVQCLSPSQAPDACGRGSQRPASPLPPWPQLMHHVHPSFSIRPFSFSRLCLSRGLICCQGFNRLLLPDGRALPAAVSDGNCSAWNHCAAAHRPQVIYCVWGRTP